MSIFNLILKEIIHRKVNFLLSLIAVIMAVVLFVSFFTIGEASKRETTRLMRDMGFNLRIIPKETDMNRFWNLGYSEYAMPEEYIYRFTEHKGISYSHLTAILQKRILWNGIEVILYGIAPEEVAPPGREKPPMIFKIEPETTHVGFEVANTLGIKKSDKIDILGKSFAVAKVLSETGSDEDIRIYAHLRDVQSLLGMEGRINEIKALECVCYTPGKEPLVTLREELEKVLPEARVIQVRSIAIARERQRMMVDSYFALIMPIMLIVCSVWVGTLAMINVRDRRYEIGIMRAIGYRSAKIASLFLGKALLIGIIGAVIGFVAGTALALGFGPDIFKVTAKAIKPMYILLGLSVIIAPIFTALSSFIPTLIAVIRDPAVTLTEE